MQSRELALLLELEPEGVETSGDLKVAPRAAAGPVRSSPSLELERQSLERSRQAEHSAERAWVPELSLMGGVLRADSARLREDRSRAIGLTP